MAFAIAAGKPIAQLAVERKTSSLWQNMGKYDFSSWTIHMAFIIVFSNTWGLIFRE